MAFSWHQHFIRHGGILCHYYPYYHIRKSWSVMLKLYKRNANLSLFKISKLHFHSSTFFNTMEISQKGYGSKYCAPSTEEIIENKMREIFESAEEFSFEEWENFKEEMLLNHFTITESNFDSITMRSLLLQNKFSLAVSFMSYLKEIGVKPNLVTYTKYMALCSKNMHLCRPDTILKLYAKVKDSVEIMPVLDATTVDCIVQGLCATDQWKKAFDYMEKLPHGYKVFGSTKDAITCAALRNDNEELGWNYITTWYRLSDPCNSSIYEEYVKLAARNYKTNPSYSDTLLTKLLTLLQKKNIAVKSSLTKELFNYFDNHKFKWNLKYTKVDNSSVCCACNKTLRQSELTHEEFELLRNSFLNKAIHKSDIFINTSHREFQNFCTFIERFQPFDVIVDGLNAAYITPDCAHQAGLAEKLLETVNKLSTSSKKILVIGKYHMKRWPKWIMSVVKKNSYIFYTHDSSQDDPFMIYAALASGKDCKFASSDLMRDHVSRLDSTHLIQLFEKWQHSHQIYLFHENGKLQLMGPLKHSICVQGNMEEGWHVPYDDEFILESYQVRNNWLCIRRAT